MAEPVETSWDTYRCVEADGGCGKLFVYPHARPPMSCPHCYATFCGAICCGNWAELVREGIQNVKEKK